MYYAFVMNKIKEVLKKQGRSQKWLSKKLGKSYVIVSRYCNNKSQPPLEVLSQVAEILDVDVRDLLMPTKTSKSAYRNKTDSYE